MNLPDIYALSTDAILFKTGNLLKDVDKTKPRILADCLLQVAGLLVKIKDDVIRLTYIELISTLNQVPADRLEKQIKKVQDEEAARGKKKIEKEVAKRNEESGERMSRLPEDINYDEYWRYLLFERRDKDKTGYWFPDGSGKDYRKLTNFIIVPLYHLKSPDNNRRLVELIGYDPAVCRSSMSLMELPSKELLKVDQFEARLFDEGPYYTEDAFNKGHLKKIIKKISHQFPICFELKTLGWQQEGFWAWSNKCYDNSLREYDKYGIVNVASKNFLSPSANENADEIRGEESAYENDKYLEFRQANINFSEWSALINEVYGKNGWNIIGYALVSMFLDICKRTTNVPLLYIYGGIESGKSTLANSMASLFFRHDYPAFNLSVASTDFAFFNRLERFANCPSLFNEFDENGIKDEWYRAFKGFYDNESREKGRGMSGKTKTQKVKCAVVIIGQYLATKDDNSVLSRSLPVLVKKKDHFTNEERDRMNRLLAVQETGLSSILLELLAHRKLVEQMFQHTYIEVVKNMTRFLGKKGITAKNRMMKNFSVMVAIIDVLDGKIQLPFTKEEFFEYCATRITDISEIMSESNALADFWKTVEYLLDKESITNGLDFKIMTETSVTVLSGKDSKASKTFADPKKVLYIRLAGIFREYAKATNQIRTGKTLNEQTLITYLKEQPYYLGLNPGTRFKGMNSPTSAYMLDYEMIGCNLDRGTDPQDSRKEESFTGIVHKPLIATSLSYRSQFMMCHQVDNKGQTTTLYTNCFINNSDQAESDIRHGEKLEIKGMLSVNAKEFRSMDIITYKVVDTADNIQLSLHDDVPLNDDLPDNSIKGKF